jgi:hypothetical protein
LAGANRQAQWIAAASRATKICCVLTKDYLESEPSCEEFGLAKADKKLIVIYKDKLPSISQAKPDNFNGPVLMYVKNQNQGLPPDDVEFIAREIFKAVRGSGKVDPGD